MLAGWFSSKQNPCALARSNGARVVAAEQGLRDDVQVAAKASVSLLRQREQQDEEMSIILVGQAGGRAGASPKSRMGCVKMAALTTTTSSPAVLRVSRRKDHHGRKRSLQDERL